MMQIIHLHLKSVRSLVYNSKIIHLHLSLRSLVYDSKIQGHVLESDVCCGIS